MVRSLSLASRRPIRVCPAGAITTQGRASLAAGLHPATGGSGSQLCSGDMLLQAPVACVGVTLVAVAAAIGVELRNDTVTAAGDLDFRGTLAVAKDAPADFTRIGPQFALDTDAPAERVATLLRLTERYCFVYQTLRRPTQLSATVSNAG